MFRLCRSFPKLSVAVPNPNVRLVSDRKTNERLVLEDEGVQGILPTNSIFYFDPEQLPKKLKFLKNNTFTKEDISKLICWAPTVLALPEENIRTVLGKLVNLFGSPEHTKLLVRRRSYFLRAHSYDMLWEKCQVLEPVSAQVLNVATILSCETPLMQMPSARLKNIVEHVRDVHQIPPWKENRFVQAINVFSGLTADSWKKKIEVCNREWGVTEEEVWEAYRKYPKFMSNSEEKIVVVKRVLVDELGLSLKILLRPKLLVWSLKESEALIFIYKEAKT